MADRETALADYRRKLLEHREREARVRSLREGVSKSRDEFDKTEDDLKALQSVGQIVGEVLRQLDEDRLIVKASSGPRYVVGCRTKLDKAKLTPGTRVSLDMTTLTIMRALPREVDPVVYNMKHEDPGNVDYATIGGLSEQIRELRESIELPLLNPELFLRVGIKPPKGVLLYGPPGTGKTLIARACAAQTNATFLKLGGPQLVQMFIGDGAKLVRDAFTLAKEKSPCIIFIDEIDAIGTKRFDSELSGDREVQRTMLELLNQLDGFSSDANVKVIAATNRADILDPALMRSGRLDRKIEFPHPTEEARARIMQIHSRKMNVNPDVNFDELARSTDDFNAAQLKVRTASAEERIVADAMRYHTCAIATTTTTCVP